MPISQAMFNYTISALGDIMSLKASSRGPHDDVEKKSVQYAVDRYWRALTKLYSPNLPPEIYRTFYSGYSGIYLGLTSSTIYTIDIQPIQEQLNKDFNKGTQLPLIYTGHYSKVNQKGIFFPDDKTPKPVNHIYTDIFKEVKKKKVNYIDPSKAEKRIDHLPKLHFTFFSINNIPYEPIEKSEVTAKIQKRKIAKSRHNDNVKKLKSIMQPSIFEVVEEVVPIIRF